jgi:hypothetical protein
LQTTVVSEPATTSPGDLFSPGDTTYVRFPSRRAAADYEDVVERYVERARKVQGVLGVARFGNVSAPGISDLDLVVVTEPDLPPEAGKTLSVNDLPEFDRELMMHDPFVVPTDGIGHIFDHLDLPRLSRVWGHLPASPQASGPAERWRRLSVLFEWLPPSQLYFAHLARTRRVDVRCALPVLHSFRHPVALAAEVLGEPVAGGDSFTGEMERLRAEWFDLTSDDERVERLAGALTRGWRLNAELCFQMDRWLLRQNLLPCLEGPPGWTVFAPGREVCLVMARMSAAADFVTGQLKLNHPLGGGLPFLPHRLRGRLNPFSFTALPAFQLAPLLAAVGHAPTVAKPYVDHWVAGRPCEGLKPRTDFEHYLVGLVERVERHAQYMRRNGLAFGQACSLLLFNPAHCPSPPQSWRKRLLRAIHVRRAVGQLSAGTGTNRS